MAYVQDLMLTFRRYGRVPVMIVVNVLCGAAGLYTYFTAGFINFVVSRVFVGLVVLAISIVPFVLGESYKLCCSLCIL